MRDIDRILRLWGAWADSDSSGIDYSHIAAGFKGLLPQQKGRERCCDDDGLFIDSCVAKLKEHSLFEYKLLICHFVYGASARSMAKYLKCSDRTIREKLSNASYFVLGLIYAINIKLQCEI